MMYLPDDLLLTSRFSFDIQWFAAEDEGRTEDPTEIKIRKARDEGKVAKSAEFSSAIVLLIPSLALGALATYFFHTMLDMLHFFLTVISSPDSAVEGRMVTAFFSYFLRIFAPIALIAFIAALLANILQVGFLFSVKPITPDLSKISPNLGRFLKKSFFSGEALFNLFKSVFKVAVIGVIAYINIRAETDRIMTFASVPFWIAITSLAWIAFRILILSALAMLVLSLPDYLFQKKQHLETLKMTKQEIKEERKTTEGDPLIRSRLRERMRDILSQNMLRNVPEATVVITNPTHFAVGMQWKEGEMPAPMIIAKGQDHMAFRIREIAQEHDIPIIENKPLARALFSEVEIGETIPEKYYQVMAIVLSEVYRMTGRAKVS